MVIFVNSTPSTSGLRIGKSAKNGAVNPIIQPTNCLKVLDAFRSVLRHAAGKARGRSRAEILSTSLTSRQWGIRDAL
jgi:hypothetical protein